MGLTVWDNDNQNQLSPWVNDTKMNRDRHRNKNRDGDCSTICGYGRYCGILWFVTKTGDRIGGSPGSDIFIETDTWTGTETGSVVPPGSETGSVLPMGQKLDFQYPLGQRQTRRCLQRQELQQQKNLKLQTVGQKQKLQHPLQKRKTLWHSQCRGRITGRD